MDIPLWLFEKGTEMQAFTGKSDKRCQFLGGSDARIIMSPDHAALIRLWKEKRGEVEPEDFTDNLVVQLGVATEALNRSWYERNTGRIVGDVQRWVQHPVHRYLAATLDGMVEDPDAVFEAKFMLPWSFSEEGAAEKHMAQLQHNMWVTASRTAVLSIITGGGKWVEMAISADLALRGNGRSPSPLRRRAATGKDRSRPDRRYERVKRLGRVCRPVSGNTAGCAGP